MSSLHTVNVWTETPKSLLIEGVDNVHHQGWGVFARSSGLICLDRVVLRGVRAEKDEADKLAAKFNDEEGFVIYEIEGDPESNIFNSLGFYTGAVALKGARMATLVELTYEGVEQS